MTGEKEFVTSIITLEPDSLSFVAILSVWLVSFATVLTIGAHHWIPLAQHRPLPRFCRYALLLMAAAAVSGSLVHVTLFGSQIDVKHVILLWSCIKILLIIMIFVGVPYQLSGLFRIVGWDQKRFIQNALNRWVVAVNYGILTVFVCVAIVAAYVGWTVVASLEPR